MLPQVELQIDINHIRKNFWKEHQHIGPLRVRRGPIVVSVQVLSQTLCQLSFRFDIGASNCAISAVCGALPLNVSTLPSTEIAT